MRKENKKDREVNVGKEMTEKRKSCHIEFLYVTGSYDLACA
jgi:hypothetical protein